MLVMLAPTFDGSPEAYARLARATGMMPYDSKARVKPGVWSVVRTLADDVTAAELVESLRSEGLPVVALPREVGFDAERRIVNIRALELHDEELVLHLRERQMAVPFRAICCIVRGEVHLGHVPARSITPSSSTFRAVVPSTSDVQMFRESQSPSSFEEYAAADLHFATVLWVARLDARSFDFSSLGHSAESPAADLDRLVDTLAERAGVRVDRGVRASSVVSSLVQGPGSRSAAGAAASARGREAPGDERFDPYSRVIAEAERIWAQSSKPPEG